MYIFFGKFNICTAGIRPQFFHLVHYIHITGDHTVISLKQPLHICTEFFFLKRFAAFILPYQRRILKQAAPDHKGINCRKPLRKPDDIFCGKQISVVTNRMPALLQHSPERIQIR